MTSVLLLPGLLSDHAFWHAPVAALARLCTPQVVSYGPADSIETMAGAVLAQAPAEFVLAGHSMGGRVALEVVRRAPDRVIGLGLFCTDYRGHQSPAARAVEAAEREHMLAQARERGMASLARSWFQNAIAPSLADNRDLLAAMVAMGARHSLEQLAAEIQAGLDRPDHASVLPSITCPTLVCAGEWDRMRPAADHARMAAQIAHARRIVIPGSGHMVAMEQPDAFNAVLRDWLAPILSPRR